MSESVVSAPPIPTHESATAEQPPASNQPSGSHDVASAASASAPPSPVRVLVADDDDALRRAMGRALRAAGFDVSEASNGQRAAELLAIQPFDVIVSDISMPDVDGLELLRRARERDLDVPVILITGMRDVQSAANAISYGAFRYLLKPFELSNLEDLVRRGASLYRMARMKREALALLGGEAEAAGDRAGLEASFQRALDGLWMAYQPIVRVSDRSLYGYEALMRSEEPSLPHPGAVLDAAEKLARLTDLGRIVRSRAAEPFGSAPEGAILFVNLHTRDLLDERLFSDTSPLCAFADRVILEITERAALDEIGDPRDRLLELRRMGYRIAIDDLGAGYAGLTSFAQLEPEIVKLDMSLVRDVHASKTKQRLIRSMTTLCKDMGMLVVAEGVETTAERDVLIELGCDLLQGYLFAKPGRPFPTYSWN